MSFVRFPNGKVWQVGDHNFIMGSVSVPGYPSLGELSKAVTGSVDGLADISAECIGGDMFSFRAYAELHVTDVDDGEVVEHEIVKADDPRLRAALKEQYELDDFEVEHALASLELKDQYGDECVIQVSGSHRQIRTPAHPAECNYVRVVAGGFEIAMWVDDEWRDDPAVVMGALIGAAAAKAGA